MKKFNLTKFEADPISFKTLKNNTHTNRQRHSSIKIETKKSKIWQNKQKLFERTEIPP